MSEKHKQVYKTKAWQAVRQAVIRRDKDICFFCGRLILKRRTIHHIQELNDDNWQDESIAYNLDNLVECHAECHDYHHHRFGYKESIANDDLSIDYSRRKR